MANPDVPYELFFHGGDSRVFSVSEEDWEETERFRWYPAGGKKRDERGKLVGSYVARRVVIDGRQTTLYLHRWIAHRAGLIPSLTVVAGNRGVWSYSIDHINGDKLDNRRTNLRVASRHEQATNPADGLRVTNTSGHRGVSFVSTRAHLPEPWYAHAGVDGKTVSLGTYATLEEAIAARVAWEATGVVPPPSGRLRSDNTTGARGVYYVKRDPPLRKPWAARVMVNGKYIQLGYFAARDEAIGARLGFDTPL